MTARSVLALALCVASCALNRPVAGPVQNATLPGEAAPGPLPTPGAAPAPTVSAETVRSLDSVRIETALQAAAARDSALDAAMLEQIALTTPPETPATTGPPSEAETAALRSMFDIDVANYVEHGRVRYWIDFFTGHARERMAIWLTRMPRYEPVMRAQLMAHGLPGDLAYLPLIESGYSPTAVSRSRAVGMWQFMKGTGRLYGLRVDGWVDERRDVPKATDAAVRFLGDLTAKFGSPYLAAAAYNGGPGRIQRGLARIEPAEDEVPVVEVSADGAQDGAPQAGDAAFFQLMDTRFIRRETKDYVPKLIAAAMIAKQPEKYGFPKVPVVAPVSPDSLVVPDATGFDVIARLSGASIDDLRDLNPAYLRPLTPPGQRSVVRLPAGTGAATQVAYDRLPAAQRLTSIPHQVKSGETLARLAKRYGVSASTLRALNPAYKSRAPRKGEIVMVPGKAQIAGWLVEDKRAALAESSRMRSHRVQRGETLASIATRYRVSASQLRTWNHLPSGARLRAGQVLRVGRGAVRPSARAKTRRTVASNSSATAKGAVRTHVVRTGETLSSLARRYGISVQALRSANGLGGGRALLAGQRITIPS